MIATRASLAGQAAAQGCPPRALPARGARLLVARRPARLAAAAAASVLRAAAASPPPPPAAKVTVSQRTTVMPMARQLNLWQKLVAALRIFFPPDPSAATARNEAKKRLRMVLYADRCAMSPRTMTDMKKSIVEALSDFVEIDQEDKVDLSVSSDPELGTVYSVSVPVRRVKADYDDQYFNAKFGEGVVSFEYDEGQTLQ